MALYESILASPHRTLNGDEADFYFVPVLDSCIITRADDAPHLSMEVHCIMFFRNVKRNLLLLPDVDILYEFPVLKSLHCATAVCCSAFSTLIGCPFTLSVYQEHQGLRSSFTLEFYKKAYDHINGAYPYWNRSSGKDHIWV